MRLSELTEGNNQKCIVVDVQREFASGEAWVEELMTFLNKQESILLFATHEDGETALDGRDITDIKEYWEENGFDPRGWDRTSIVDKGYGHLRGWMDENIPNNITIRVIREMYQQKVSSSRDLFGGENGDTQAYNDSMEQLGVPQSMLPDAESSVGMADTSIEVEWTSIGQLKEFSGAYIMGGYRTECLAEVQLLMNAFNIKYTQIQKFIFG
jgi:hypothetical protein|tara:strand:+ start:94 stop:729 length:636 start_codon:yes stop_codon:yes gene_type:complete